VLRIEIDCVPDESMSARFEISRLCEFTKMSLFESDQESERVSKRERLDDAAVIGLVNIEKV